ncbi:hypothetical protein ACFV16_38085 [Streptomyces massasporeus]|uniref:hypothetical protein n=1 Tax=Streptomyces massasporeus TaxID=67324 RepID=UPI0036C25357
MTSIGNNNNTAGNDLAVGNNNTLGNSHTLSNTVNGGAPAPQIDHPFTITNSSQYDLLLVPGSVDCAGGPPDNSQLDSGGGTANFQVTYHFDAQSQPKCTARYVRADAPNLGIDVTMEVLVFIGTDYITCTADAGSDLGCLGDPAFPRNTVTIG